MRGPSLMLFALACVVACVSSRPRCVAYHFHASFPAAYQGAARVALTRWSAFSGHDVVLEDGNPDDETCSFRSIASTSPEYASLKAAMGGADFFAAHVEPDGSIAIAEGQWFTDGYCTADRNACATWILMHELAHEYRLMHVADPSAVMGTTAPAPRLAYTAVDRAECIRVGSCGQEISP